MLKYWIWLTELNLKNQTRLTLLQHFETPERLYHADEEEILLTRCITREQAEILRNRDLTPANRILDACTRLGQTVVTIQDAAYPDRLRNIFDPPCLLYVQGRLPAFDETAAIAVVGTRSCTPYGLACGEELGYGITRGGGLVVSGLALGIDASATRGALRAGGPAVGVAGCGLDVKYPSGNRGLYEDVAAAGAILSEYPPGTPPSGWHFPVRNRILSGLSVATLVVEAPSSSGAIITAQNALHQGRQVFAVPGPINSRASDGCNQMIKDGRAGMATGAWDVLSCFQDRFPDTIRAEALAMDEQDAARTRPAPQRRSAQTAPPVRPPAKPVPAPVELPVVSGKSLSDDQMTLLELLSPDTPQQVDGLIEQSGIPTRRVLSALTVLEIDGMVRQHNGKRFTRVVTLVRKRTP